MTTLSSTLEKKERFIHLAQHLSSNKEEAEIEAPYLYKHGPYYYLFVNWGACCKDIGSSYNIRMGRSKNVHGPYLDQNNKRMRHGGGTLFLEAEERYIGPGHVGIIQIEDREILTYHYYDRNDQGISKLAARELFWNDKGWPELGEHLIKLDR